MQPMNNKLDQREEEGEIVDQEAAGEPEGMEPAKKRATKEVGKKVGDKTTQKATKKVSIRRAPAKATESISAVHEAECATHALTMPTSRAKLAAFLLEHMELRLAERALLEGNSAPLDYLEHAFFEPCMQRNEHMAKLPVSLPIGQPVGLPIALPLLHDAAALKANSGVRANLGVRDCVVWANRGGGKTFLGAVATLLDMIFKPGIEIRILASSIEQASRMHAHLLRFFTLESFSSLVEGKATTRRLELHNGSRVEVLAQSHASVRGTRVQKLRCDEVDVLSQDLWEAAQLVTRSAKCGAIEVIGSVDCLSTMHKPHGIMRDIVAEAYEGKRRLFRWGVVDTLETCGDEYVCEGVVDEAGVRIVPTCVLLEECGGRAKRRSEDAGGFMPVRDAITLKGRVSQSMWKSEMLCQRPRRSDSVYPEFDVARHVINDMCVVEARVRRKNLQLVGGFDFGFRAPSALVLAAVDEAGVMWILDEWVQSEVTLAVHIERIKGGGEEGWPRPDWLAVDPAGKAQILQTGTSAVEDMRAAGLVVRYKSASINSGLKLVKARLDPAAGDPRLLVHARCKTLISCLERYHYSYDDKESLVPVKDGFDHAPDALRYLVQHVDKPMKAWSGNYLR